LHSMAYQVTIYSEAERAQYRDDLERNGVDAGDGSRYSPAADKVGFFGGAYQTEAELRLSFRRPRTNLATKKEWIGVLVRAVKHCRRKGSAERGLSNQELMELVRFNRAHPENEKRWLAAGKSKAKLNELQWSAPGIRVLCGSSDQLSRGLDGSETLALVRALGLEADVIKTQG
jgi:hypothetical protein